jgi:5'-methylthioinosine phosphorylase
MSETVGGVGIIGGTGLASIENWTETRKTVVDTPYGRPSAPLAEGELHGQRLVFLPRHGADHSVAPHKINYRANIWALHNTGVSSVVAIAAVGGISAEASPTTIVIPHQLVDYTYGRAHTFFDGESAELKHIDFTEPYNSQLHRSLIEAAGDCGVPCVEQGVYAATQGPRLESAAEIDRLERDGCTIVGMTGMPEAALARELELPYACCAVVVNWAAGRSQKVIDMELIRRNVAIGREKLALLISAFLSAL